MRGTVKWGAPLSVGNRVLCFQYTKLNWEKTLQIIIKTKWEWQKEKERQYRQERKHSRLMHESLIIFHIHYHTSIHAYGISKFYSAMEIWVYCMALNVVNIVMEWHQLSVVSTRRLSAYKCVLLIEYALRLSTYSIENYSNPHFKTRVCKK